MFYLRFIYLQFSFYLFTCLITHGGKGSNFALTRLVLHVDHNLRTIIRRDF